MPSQQNTNNDLIKHKLKKLLRIKQQIKELQAKEKEIKEALLSTFGKDFEGTFDDVKVVIKEIESTRIDVKELKEKFPGIVQQVEKKVKSTRIDVKRI